MSDAYEAHIDGLVAELARNPLAYPTADLLVERGRVIPDHPANDSLLRAVASPLVPFTPRTVGLAMDKARKAAQRALVVAEKAAEKAAKDADRAAELARRQAEQQARVTAILGRAYISTEREMIPAFLSTCGWDMDFTGNFVNRTTGKVVTYQAILEDIQLTAADLGLTRKPLLLTDKNFARALSEYARAAREQRFDSVWQSIERVPVDAGRDADAVIREFKRICGLYFKEPAFSAAAVMKIIWQVKRKMQRLPIVHHHFVVLFSQEQGSGKTTFLNLLKQPLRDLCKDVADVSDLLSNSQLDLFSYYLVEVPEMSGADRADMAKLKALVTAPTVTRRLYFTQSVQEQFMASTFVGTSNVPLATLMKDTSGMRRMVQCDVKRIRDIGDERWAEIAAFDFGALWQAVDHEGADPMTDFMVELQDKQEGMRARDRVELWLEDFAHASTSGYDGYEVSLSDAPRSYTYATKTLFKHYRMFESLAFAGSTPMALSNFSKRLQELIDAESVENWSYSTHGRRTYFRIDKNDGGRLRLA